MEVFGKSITNIFVLDIALVALLDSVGSGLPIVDGFDASPRGAVRRFGDALFCCGDGHCSLFLRDVRHSKVTTQALGCCCPNVALLVHATLD